MPQPEPPILLFVWDNFGPLHNDRVSAVAEHFKAFGLQFRAESQTYDWQAPDYDFPLHTVSPPGSGMAVIAAILRLVVRQGVSDVFLCHYERWEMLATAIALRLFGRRVFTMIDSKFDDYGRHIAGEIVKSLFMAPYNGALTASIRSRDYMRFLGHRRVAMGYDTVRTARFAPPSDVVHLFAARPFVIVARLVPKKNLALAISAFARFHAGDRIGRRLVICGSGPLEQALKQQARHEGVDAHVDFKGFVQTAEVAVVLQSGLALIQPSWEEQFGQSIAEALSAGLPVLCSDACGARDELVRTGVNGFVFEPDNEVGLAWLMGLMSEDDALWRRLSAAALAAAPLADVARFVEGVRELLGGGPP